MVTKDEVKAAVFELVEANRRHQESLSEPLNIQRVAALGLEANACGVKVMDLLDRLFVERGV